MIRKVPNMQAWVMHCKDYSNWEWTSTIHRWFQTILPLPLFELNPNGHIGHSIEENELMLVVDGYVHSRPYTLEQVEEINKTWNKFYEESTRK